MDWFEANLLANLFQLATLALGVCLLAIWINYRKSSPDELPKQQPDRDSANVASGSEYQGALRR
jgi:hypothetical protein